jgi:hypothetical protein
MQPDYTFAIHYNRANILTRASQVKAKLKPDLAYEAGNTGSRTTGCLIYSPRQPQRLIKLLDDLSWLAVVSASSPAMRLGKADILADLVASNLGRSSRKLSAASRGPIRLCDPRVVQMLRDLVPSPTSSPSPVPSPIVKPSPSPAVVQPSPSPPPSECVICMICVSFCTIPVLLSLFC